MTEPLRRGPVVERPAGLGSGSADLIAALMLGLLIRVGFMLYTGRIWEDALITLEHAKNAASGLGLTHHVGEGPTHGFTSALSVLIPLTGEIVLRGSGLIVLQLVSLAAMVVALVYGRALARELGLSRVATVLVLMFLAVEQNHVFYGASGMETQIAVAILLGALVHSIRGEWFAAGVALGLAVLARPDFVLLVPFLLLGVGLRRGALAAGRSSLIGALVLLPWAMFTTLYYGSPVPHTIGVKSAGYANLPGGDIPGWVAEQLYSHVEPMLRSFMPFFADTMVVGSPGPAVASALVASTMYALIIAGAISLIRDRRWWPILGFLASYAAYRVFLLPTSYYDWYVPPFTAVAVLLAAGGLDRLRMPQSGRRLAVAVIVVAYALPLPWLFAMEREVQVVPEDGVRREVARYLAAHVQHRESVTSESAGYIGVDTSVLLWDFPGLTSPTALAAVRSLPQDRRNTPGLVAAARPTWAVLRESEHDVLRIVWPDVAAEYRRCATFGPGGDVLTVHGMVKRSFDLRFDVYRRGACPPGSARW